MSFYYLSYKYYVTSRMWERDVMNWLYLSKNLRIRSHFKFTSETLDLRHFIQTSFQIFYDNFINNGSPFDKKRPIYDYNLKEKKFPVQNI